MNKFTTFVLFFLTNIIYASGVVNVYTSRHYDTDKKIYEEFEKRTGIKVNITQNNDISALIKKIELEGKSTEADIFMTVGIGDLYRAKKLDLLQIIPTKNISKNIPSQFIDKDKKWVGLTYRARIIAYNPEKVNISELSTYEDLANKKWNKKILTRTSKQSYNQHLIAFMIAKNGENKTKIWAKNLVENFARVPKGNDRDQAKAVNSGIGDIAIINSYYMGKMANSKDPLEKETASKLKIFFPNQKDGGTHINLSGVGITKYSKNKENAIKFIEFLTNKFSQEIFSKSNYEYPTNPKAEISPLVKSWGNFKISKIDYDKIGENLDKANFIADEVMWK